MAKIEYNITSNLDKVAYAFEMAPEDTVRSIQTAIELIAFRLARVSAPKAPSDTGKLQGDLARPEIKPLYARVGSNRNYAVFVHEGTKPHYPPIKALTGWASRHNISPYVVARAISKRGTKANPFLKDSLAETESYREQTISKQMNSVLQSIESRHK